MRFFELKLSLKDGQFTISDVRDSSTAFSGLQ
jgi:hypothetical protein